jgi:hypothetical protein
MTGRRSAPSLPADLKIARVIPRSKFDFPIAIFPVVAVRKHLGREPLQTDVGKTHRRHRAAQRAAVRLAAMGSGANRPSAFNKARSLAAST